MADNNKIFIGDPNTPITTCKNPDYPLENGIEIYHRTQQLKKKVF